MPRRPARPLAFACACGALEGHLTPAAVQSGTHVVCYCADCRAGEVFFGQPDPAPGPVDIFQLSPDGIVIEKGRQHLALMRLSPKGLLRWYANCCNTPIATTLKSPKTPFAGFNTRRLADIAALGPVRTRAFVPQPGGGHKHVNIAPAVYGLFSRMLAARLSGRWRETAFFDTATGKPVAEARILTKEERQALYR
ncbi:DUF6151 family protein [Ruegeria marina]|uniref:CENP-V/GFA domain-containing protein n=1 Tax=Ruegeria marina TaxID=639004 RepID=A0A1G6SCR7_9RHOB|nr:DUF6151 family protein [Ruegeria marina]SDD14688.1 hypothetical protein SAMN04488239_105243 [Ruegeria marina]